MIFWENQELEYPISLLKKLLSNYKLSPSALSKISGIPESTISNYANDVSIPLDTVMDLYLIIILLTSSMEAQEEDERVQLLITGMVEEFYISVETIGIYSKMPPKDIH